MGNAQDPAICHLTESPFLYPRVLKYPAVACPMHGKISLWELGKDMERAEAVDINAQKKLPGQTGTYHMPWPSLPVDLGSVYFIFYYWWPWAEATHKCLCWQQGAAFPGLCFERQVMFQSFILSVRSQFSPPKPVPGSKQSLLLQVKILFLTPCLASLEDTVAHFIHEVLFS